MLLPLNILVLNMVSFHYDRLYTIFHHQKHSPTGTLLSPQENAGQYTKLCTMPS